MIQSKQLGISGLAVAIALLLTGSPANATPLTSLPDGDYTNGSLTLRKSGSVVVGARSKDSICFRGRLVNGTIATGWDAGPIFGDRSGNFRRRFEDDFDSQFPITVSHLVPAGQAGQIALDRCTDIFRPIVNLGINVGMADRAVQQQLAKFNWQRIRTIPRAMPNLAHWGLGEDGVPCDGGGNFCILTWRKDDTELSVLLAVGLVTAPVAEICVTAPQSFSASCQFFYPYR
ncbi:MAG: hypothetical protein SVX43_07135 [Cyanobacteriota bacterium]|nr:hypothetical protein [Cyanobacteriota bacterium]